MNRQVMKLIGRYKKTVLAGGYYYLDASCGYYTALAFMRTRPMCVGIGPHKSAKRIAKARELSRERISRLQQQAETET